MAEETKPKSRRDTVTERLKTKYPDREWADDEELFGQINDDYDEYDNTLNGYRERDGKLVEMFNKDPRNAQFITDMARGEDPWLNTIKRLGIEGITDILNDPSKQEEYAKANQEHIEKLAEEDALEKEFETNFEKSKQMLEQYQQKHGLTDEQLDAAFDLLVGIANNAVLGIYTEESMDMAMKAINHDSDVATATDEGMIAGKNVKAEEKLRKPKTGDGTPNLQGSNNSASNQRNHKKTIFDWAQAANS